MPPLRTSRIAYGAGPTEVSLSRPPRPWTPAVVGIGAGIEWSAAGVPAAWVTRLERALSMVLVCTEAEWPAVRAWLEHAMAGGSFSWYPDAAEATAHVCYLVSPRIDEGARPARGGFPGDLELPITIRRTDGVALEPEYF